MKKTFTGSVTAKILFVAFLLILMLIPVSMIRGVINERQWRYQDAVREVSGKWGEQQSLSGPVLTVPYTYRWQQTVGEGKEEKVVTYSAIRQAHFFPDDLNYDATLVPTVRKRGIFEVVVYDLKVKVTGALPIPDFKDFDISPDDLLWDKAFISVGIPDTRGINENIPLKSGNRSLTFFPGVGNMKFLTSGIHAPLNLNGPIDSQVAFDFDLDLKGSQGLYFWPTGKQTTASIASPWSAPKFDGYFLPEQNDDNETFEDGFNANWKMSYFGRSYPQSWINQDNQTQYQSVVTSQFGVQLILPVDFYQKNERSIKYAVLFIGLTFLMFFCFEILHKGLKVHPFQYILVGVAMSVFYLLLLSFSEHIGFAMAYIVSALATTGLITMYSTFVLQAQRKGLSIGLLLLAIYAYLYSLLQLQDYALLLGSVVTFLILAVVMWVTRKIDWYNLDTGSGK